MIYSLYMLKCPTNKIFKATTRGRKFGHRPPVVALKNQVLLKEKNICMNVSFPYIIYPGEICLHGENGSFYQKCTIMRPMNSATKPVYDTDLMGHHIRDPDQLACSTSCHPELHQNRKLTMNETQ